MKLSTKGRYGLRAMIDLACRDQAETVSINSISKRQNISEGYLEQIIATLKKDGLLKSKRGAGGGYSLAKPADTISVGDILRSLEGSLDPVECPGVGGESSCENEGSCVTKYVWKKINDSINSTVDNITLSELVTMNESVDEPLDGVQKHCCS